MSASPSGGGPGPRKDVGDATSSHKHPPHISENAEDAPIQQDNAATKAPVIPPTAHGRDTVSTEELEDQQIREESMYGGRPSEDKDWDPTKGNP